MAANRTVGTRAEVRAFVAGIADAEQRSDTETLIELMAKTSGEPPKMWGSSIIGFGSVHYKYDSGREGDMARIAFSPRKGKFVLYHISDTPERAAILARIGKYQSAKECLYVKRLADVDMEVLTELVSAALA